MNLFFHKNYYSHLNNLFIFSNLKKNKSNKKLLLYMYLTYMFDMLFIYKKYILILKKISFQLHIKKFIKILKIKFLLKLFLILKFIKIKIRVRTFKISYLFDLLVRNIKKKNQSKILN